MSDKNRKTFTFKFRPANPPHVVKMTEKAWFERFHALVGINNEDFTTLYNAALALAPSSDWSEDHNYVLQIVEQAFKSGRSVTEIIAALEEQVNQLYEPPPPTIVGHDIKITWDDVVISGSDFDTDGSGE